MLYGKIFQLIDRLAQKYINSCQGCDVPVPLTLVYSADNLHKIEIRHLPLHKIHGALWYIGRHWIIQINKNDPPNVQKFTAFHEAFHIIELLNLHRKLDEQKYQRRYFDEVLADQFASCILMPVDKVRDTWFSAGDLHQIAKVFDVSEPIAAFRLKCLHLI
jgi:Zn-dependent peptidase ImmA (M78 family)